MTQGEARPSCCRQVYGNVCSAIYFSVIVSALIFNDSDHSVSVKVRALISAVQQR